MLPKSGDPIETRAYARALLNISFGASSKGVHPRGPPFIHLSKFPVDEPTSRFPYGAPMEIDAHLQSPFLPILQGQKYW
jgi:hypothetical protein